MNSRQLQLFLVLSLGPNFIRMTQKIYPDTLLKPEISQNLSGSASPFATCMRGDAGVPLAHRTPIPYTYSWKQLEDGWIFDAISPTQYGSIAVGIPIPERSEMDSISRNPSPWWKLAFICIQSNEQHCRRYLSLHRVCP